MNSPVDRHNVRSGERPFNVLRGIRAALLCGAIGGAAPILFVVTYTMGRWVIEGTSDFDRAYDLYRLPQVLVFPVIGTAFVFAAAGWATYAPKGSYRFARTLLLIAVISVPSWFALAGMGMAVPRYKSIEHPPIYPREALLLVVPPAVTAVVLTMLRSDRSRVDVGSPE